MIGKSSQFKSAPVGGLIDVVLVENGDGTYSQAVAKKTSTYHKGSTVSTRQQLYQHPDVTALPSTLQPAMNLKYKTAWAPTGKASDPELLTEYTNTMEAIAADQVLEEERDNHVLVPKRFVPEDLRFREGELDWMEYYGDVQGRRDRAMFGDRTLLGCARARSRVADEVNYDSTPVSQLGIRSAEARRAKMSIVAGTTGLDLASESVTHQSKYASMKASNGIIAGSAVSNVRDVETGNTTAGVQTNLHVPLTSGGVQTVGMSVDSFNSAVSGANGRRAVPAMMNKVRGHEQAFNDPSVHSTRAVRTNTARTLVNRSNTHAPTEEDATPADALASAAHNPYAVPMVNRATVHDSNASHDDTHASTLHTSYNARMQNTDQLIMMRDL